MAKTYTFPDQETVSGTISFIIVTSVGSGSQTLTEKYFSSDIQINDETEFIGGELKASNCSVKIDYDADSLFRSTIFPIAKTTGEYVTLKIRLEGNTIFYGVIQPSTISFEPFYATNDALDGQIGSASFNCIWIVSLLKNISKSTLSSNLLTFCIANGKYSAPSDGYLGGRGYFYVSVYDVLRKSLDLLNTVYSVSSSLTFNAEDVTFYSKGDARLDNSGYNVVRVKNPGDIDYGSLIFTDYVPHLLLGRISGVNGTTGLPNAVAAESGTLFYDSGDDTFLNAYEFFVGILRSFQLYCHISYSTSPDILISLGTRFSGGNIVLSDVLSEEEAPMSDVARSGVDISSLQSGTRYRTNQKRNTGNEFSYDVPLDFGNDNDFPGGQDYVNSLKSLLYPAQYAYNPVTGFNENYFSLVRYIGLGQNRIPYNFFPSDFNWDVISGSWFTDVSGRARVANPQDAEITYTLDEEVSDGLIFSLRAMTDTTANVFITFKFYNGSTLIGSSTTTLNANGVALDLTDYYFLCIGIIPPETMRRKNASPINKVGIFIDSATSDASKSVWIKHSKLLIVRTSLPQYVGMEIEDNFNEQILTRRKYTLNGIRSDYKPSDYFTVGGEDFYVKSVTLKLNDNETEIEAINYQ